MIRETLSLTKYSSGSVRFSKICRHTELETRNMIITEQRGQGQVVERSSAGDSVEQRYRGRTRNRQEGGGRGEGDSF